MPALRSLLVVKAVFVLGAPPTYDNLASDSRGVLIFFAILVDFIAFGLWLDQNIDPFGRGSTLRPERFLRAAGYGLRANDEASQKSQPASRQS